MALIPQIEELLELRHQAHAIGLGTHHRVRSVLSGLYASVFRGQGMDFEEAREYREGDEIRNMDWRVTARTGTPHLKVFREERERAVMLCVDTGPHMQFGTRHTFKSVQAARVAALLGWAASNSQDRVGAMLYGASDEPLRFFRPSRARRSFWRMLQALSSAPASGVLGASSPEVLLETLDKAGRVAPTGALIFLIGDLNRDPAPLQPILGRLQQKHEVVIVPVDDPADRSIPAIGRVIFEGTDGHQVEVDTDNEEGRDQYRAEWEFHRRALESICQRLGITLMKVDTDGDVQSALVEGLRRRQLRGRR